MHIPVLKAKCPKCGHVIEAQFYTAHQDGTTFVDEFLHTNLVDISTDDETYTCCPKCGIQLVLYSETIWSLAAMDENNNEIGTEVMEEDE